MSAPLVRRSLSPALHRVAGRGFAHLDGLVGETFLRGLRREVEGGPLRRMAGTFGAAGVRMEIERFPLEEANTALDRLRAGHIRGAAVLEVKSSPA